jgi:hypothetical protein
MSSSAEYFGVATVFSDDHYVHPMYQVNSGSFRHMGTLPLPPKDGMPVAVNHYEDVPEEPKFDPDVHLDLSKPKYNRIVILSRDSVPMSDWSVPSADMLRCSPTTSIRTRRPRWTATREASSPFLPPFR